MSISVNSADSFDKWQNSKENYQKFQNDEKVESFKLFDYDSQAENLEEAYKESMKQFSQQYIDKYDKDGNGKMDYDEFISMQEAAYEEMFGEEIDMTIPGIDDAMKESFEQLNKLNPDDPDGKYIDAEEYGTFLSVVDAQDEETMDGQIDYVLFNTVPGMKGYDKALKNFYNAIWGK